MTWKIKKVKKPVYPGYDETYLHIVEDDCVLCSLRSWHNRQAQKMVAAPDLLEACQEALEALFNTNPRYRKRGCFNSGHNPCQCTACLLNKVIAKATE